MAGQEKTQKISEIDEDYIASLAEDTWVSSEDEVAGFLTRQTFYEESWRNLVSTEDNGPWEGSSNIHIPYSLSYIKAVHARLWQLFSNPEGFFEVKAKREDFKDKEQTIRFFMNWMLMHEANDRRGIRREVDRWLWDVVAKGSGYLKAFWRKEVKHYREIQPVVDIKEKQIFTPENLTGGGVKSSIETTVRDEEVDVTEEIETLQVKRLLFEDVRLPRGQHDPQEAHHVVSKVYMTDDDLKEKLEQGAFFKDAVETALNWPKQDVTVDTEPGKQVKQMRRNVDGYNATRGMLEDAPNFMHEIFEFMGPAYVLEKEVNSDEFDKDPEKRKQEIIAWVHRGTKKVLGWTFLSTISPGGIRPIFKADYVTFPDRTQGVGIAEMTYDMGRYLDATYNLRIDNGTLASIPMFVYKAGSSFKPQAVRMAPGKGLPLDDVNDMKQFNFPYLNNFGTQEEASLVGWTERLLALSDIQMGRAPTKVGALRTGTGANLLSAEAGIQLEIHFDRIADCMSKLLEFCFKLCRERVPEETYYRVTGERGEPIFGKVDKRDLKGDFDFDIRVDILGQSQVERQQQAVLMMNTLQNPMYMQTGILQPHNLYELAKNFLKTHKIARVDAYITPPPNYTGPKLSPNERIFRIVTGYVEGVVESVILEENHEQALKVYEDFIQNSDLMGLIASPKQIATFDALRNRHQELLQAQQAPAMPNTMGMQTPRDGFQGLDSTAALQAPQGEVNGPVV